MKVSKPIVLLAFLTLLFACKKDDPAAEGSQILPGSGISELKIGAAAQTAIDLWGAGLKSYVTFGTQTTHQSR